VFAVIDVVNAEFSIAFRESMRGFYEVKRNTVNRF